jgi:hypothetical protein
MPAIAQRRFATLATPDEVAVERKSTSAGLRFISHKKVDAEHVEVDAFKDS